MVKVKLKCKLRMLSFNPMVYIGLFTFCCSNVLVITDKIF